MEDIKEPINLHEEIKELEERLVSLPDNQYEERIAIRKKLISKYLEFNNILINN